jgi:hypothetical protein
MKFTLKAQKAITRIIQRPLSAIVTRGLELSDLTNVKGEKRRNVGKLNNKLSIVNQLVDLHFLLFVNITGN